MGEYYQSEYSLTTSSNNKSAAAVKLQLTQITGTTNGEVIGAGSGTAKTLKLSHVVNNGAMLITANNVTLSSKNYELQDDAQHITITAPLGQVLRATYDWVSVSPRISQFSVVFSE